MAPFAAFYLFLADLRAADTVLSVRLLSSLHCRAQHEPALVRRKIVARVHGAAVVPNDQVAGPPHVPVIEFRLLGMIEERLKECIALRLWQVLDPYGHQPIDIDRLASGLVMGSEHRMRRLAECLDAP